MYVVTLVGFMVNVLAPSTIARALPIGVRCLVLRWPISASDSKPGVVNDGLQGFLADEALESI